jgi:hypothetical protein
MTWIIVRSPEEDCGQQFSMCIQKTSSEQESNSRSMKEESLRQGILSPGKSILGRVFRASRDVAGAIAPLFAMQ